MRIKLHPPPKSYAPFILLYNIFQNQLTIKSIKECLLLAFIVSSNNNGSHDSKNHYIIVYQDAETKVCQHLIIAESVLVYVNTHTHTHTHTERERERGGERETETVCLCVCVLSSRGGSMTSTCLTDIRAGTKA